MDNGACSFQGCDRKAISKGLCGSHYKQARRNQPLRPLRLVRGIKLPGLVVSVEVAGALDSLGLPSRYVAAKAVLDAFVIAQKVTAMPPPQTCGQPAADLRQTEQTEVSA